MGARSKVIGEIRGRQGWRDMEDEGEAVRGGCEVMEEVMGRHACGTGRGQKPSIV